MTADTAATREWASSHVMEQEAALSRHNRVAATLVHGASSESLEAALVNGSLPAKTRLLLLVGLPGLEPGTSSLSEKRSNRLSYRPAKENRRDNLQHPGLHDNLIEERRGGKYNRHGVKDILTASHYERSA